MARPARRECEPRRWRADDGSRSFRVEGTCDARRRDLAEERDGRRERRVVREPPPDPCDLVPRGVERLRARAREVDLQNERRATRAAPQGREDAPAPEPRDDDGVAQVLGQPALRRVRRRRGRRARRGVAHVFFFALPRPESLSRGAQLQKVPLASE